MVDPNWWVGGQSRTELWFAWLEIAIEQERLAWKARNRVITARDSAGNVPLELEAETKAAMVAITAAAAVLETVGGNLRLFAGELPTMRSAALRLQATVRALYGDVLTPHVMGRIETLF